VSLRQAGSNTYRSFCPVVCSADSGSSNVVAYHPPKIPDEGYVVRYAGPDGATFEVMGDAGGGTGDDSPGTEKIAVTNDLGQGTLAFRKTKSGHPSFFFYGWEKQKEGEAAVGATGFNPTRSQAISIASSLRYFQSPPRSR
jgi:hypothetical protein